jgi:exopolyphosphatase/guanosine-5'-triphosphate,3'-diphosphate pyrophosphatase
VANLAAVDVGTNSFHLIVAHTSEDGRFEVIDREKEMIRLGSGSGDMKRLDAAAMDRGVATLTRFAQIAAISGAPLRAVATSAVREAENHQEFLARAREEAGVDIEVISGVEEARLIHLGVLQAVPVFDQRLVLCDIGGGSTELLVGERGEVLASRSFKLGAMRLSNRFFPGERVHPSAVSSCSSYIRSILQPFVREVEEHGFDVAVGSSGTIQAMAQLAHVRDGGEPLRTYNRYLLTAKAIGAVVKDLTAAPTVRARARLPGMDPKRADIILAGALILQVVVDSLGIDELEVSDYALREGVLLDTVQRGGAGALHHLRDVSRRSVRHLAELCDDDLVHSAHVSELALQLFDGTAVLHGLDVGCRDYLEAGALLANVGLFISHSKHHLHSYYVIRNSEVLTGFTDNEIEIIAQTARYHRKSAPRERHPEFAALRPEDQAAVRTLAGLLRVAIGLDRSHDQRVTSVRVARRGKTIVVQVDTKPDAAIDLELYAANERVGLLEEVLGRRVVVEAAPQAGSRARRRAG